MNVLNQWGQATGFCLVVFLAVTLSGCKPGDDRLPDLPDADEIEPFDPRKMQFHYTFSLEQARTYLQNNANVLIIDVRTPEEFAEGHIPGALNYDTDSSGYEIEISGVKRKARILLYDNGEQPSRAATAIGVMKRLGFRNLAEMAGGFPAWKEAGYAFIRDLPTAMTSP